ncbi:TlpA disulfide reductase family protein [Chelatococcus sp. SYSU_G07232]|uniref:TlpA disulfide reductase family protein n=1 Tax=Chelatococcus albus TaxID=3047466 RepID=A0ABT7AJN8_9HYPH|nr:TlpA disulfide reductase family protein [Chelatococcus sp. SYSU_G07232]MDJ1159568.1 TlpA disulfide reductase family protein [Chelatococcus sp. SYSU_G07232]
MTDTTKSSRRPLVLAAIAGLAVIGAAAALYGTRPSGGNGENAQCRAAAPVVERMAPLARGEVAAVQVAKEPRALPALAFTGPDGKPRTLADFKGKTVLLNLWATWCAPCRKEMPALDALQAKLGAEDFEVVAVNIDTRNLDRPKSWLAEVGVRNLAYYSDPEAKTFQELKAVGKAFGMPTTVLVGKDGCELAHLSGPAEWASDDAVALLRAALGR